MTIADLRQEYTLAGLRRLDLNPDPFKQFPKWFDESASAGVTEPNAMTLSTVDASGQPSGRTVLLKVFDARGFGFFSNYESRKGNDMAANPRVCLTFLWQQLERQVIVRGEVSKLGREESTKYFHSRPLGSQLGAWVSQQSSIVPSREFLEGKLTEVTERYQGETIPLPEHWGGYMVTPSEFEFWQGRRNRLHDRFLYSRQFDGIWKLERLAP